MYTRYDRNSKYKLFMALCYNKCFDILTNQLVVLCHELITLIFVFRWEHCFVTNVDLGFNY